MRIAAYVGGVFGLALLVVLLVRADFAGMVHVLLLAGWPLLWLIPYRLSYFLLFAIGWQFLLEPYDGARRAGLPYLLWVTSVREAIDRLLPVASIGGGVAGVRLLRWRGLALVPVSATVIAEIILTLIASYLFAALGFGLMIQHDSGTKDGHAPLALLYALPVPVACFLLLRYGSVFVRLQRVLAPFAGIHAASQSAAALDQELRDCLGRWRPLLVAGVLQFTALLAASFEIWFALRLFGHPVSAKIALIMESATQAVRHLAFFIPGGLGVQEAGLILFGHAFGVSADLALAVSMAKRIREVLCGLPALISWQWLEARRLRLTAQLGKPLLSTCLWGFVALMAQPSHSQAPAPAASATDTKQQAAVADLGNAQVSPPGLGLSRWINPATAPFIPVPVIGVDPNSGTTLGILPTWVHTNDNHEISRIIAPDLVHNPNFGVGAHGRIFDYPSENEQWSVVTGYSQRVQRLVDAEYQDELLRKQFISFNASLIYNRDGTPRFYGIGNSTVKGAETNYTGTQELAQVQVGLNFSHAWQLLYTLRPERLEVTPGTLSGVATITSRFSAIPGLGTNSLLLNRLSVIYDTRNDLVVPRAGSQWIVYGGLASSHGLLNDSTYSEAGIDGREFWALDSRTVIAAHAALRYLPSAHQVPFWALSALGGDRDVIGGDQALRGYGAGRFYDRDSFGSSVELRRTMLSFDASTSHIDVELTPFVDLGRVFSRTSTFPLSHLHEVAGVGFRGVARPFIVGYVDIGYGSEGAAAFTGINYPF